MSKKVAPQKRKIDVLLQNYTDHHQHPVNQIIHLITIPLATFGFMGMIWALPFPFVGFLGKYNGFINWASFLIAFAIYYYYRLSPVLSYAILLMVFLFSYGIVSFEKLEAHHNWPPVGVLCTGIFISGMIVQAFGLRYERKTVTLSESLQYLLAGPLWLFYNLFKVTGIRH